METDSMKQSYNFRQITAADKPLLDSWFAKPYVREFWCNSAETEQGLCDYIAGKKDLYEYWIGELDGTPFCYFMTSNAADGKPAHIMPHMPPHGTMLTIDFMIGEEDFLGKGLAAPTLIAFMNFLQNEYPTTTRFFIDPAVENPRAIKVYEKAGFVHVDEYTPQGGYFAGKLHWLMLRDADSKTLNL